MKFGEVLQQLMQENGVTEQQLSDDLRISQSMLEHFIRCMWEPNFNTLKRVADYFQVNTDYLLDYRSKSAQAQNQMDSELLHVFRSMPPKQQRIFLAQGQAIGEVCGPPGHKNP